MRTRIQTLLLVITMMGCGDSGETEHRDDGGMPPVPTIVSITPSDGAAAVSVLGDAKVLVDGPLNPDTVNDTTVRLLNDYGHPISAEATWDEGTLAITLSPTFALRNGRPHRIEVDGLEDPHGREVESATATFTPFYNPRVSWVSYEAEDVVGHGVFTHDERGRMLQERQYRDPGNDGTWFTEDDILSTYVERTYDDDADTATFAIVNGPGDDGTWFTDDDELSWYVEFTTNSQGDWTREVRFNRGPDLILGTADDGVREYSDWMYDASGRFSHSVRYDDPGADDVFFTEDDVISMMTDLTWDESGIVLTGQINGHPGDDRLWHTEDDIFLNYWEGTFDGDDLRYVTYWAPFGPDGIRGTEDDEPDAYVDKTYTVDRQILGSTSYGSPGPDDEWFTSDDVRESGGAYEYDADGNIMTSTGVSDPGLDGLWDTADDQHTDYTYAAF